jgi:hypothetical protein
MGKRILLALTLLLAAAASATIPLAASAEGMSPLVIGARFNLETGTGTFSACCAINDSGTASLAITSFEVRRNEGVFEATNTFTGAEGSFTIAIRGTTGPLTIDGVENPRHIARGRWQIASATGDYVGLQGQGELTAMSDFAAGTLTAVDDGLAKLP